METMEYEVCWRGDSWRDVPPPVIATPRQPVPCGKPTTIHARQLLCDRNRASVRAAFGEDWQNANELAKRVGVTVQAVRHHLREAIEDGIAESMVVASVRSFGRSHRVYRRRQTQQEAA